MLIVSPHVYQVNGHMLRRDIQQGVKYAYFMMTGCMYCDTAFTASGVSGDYSTSTVALYAECKSPSLPYGYEKKPVFTNYTGYIPSSWFVGDVVTSESNEVWSAQKVSFDGAAHLGITADYLRFPAYDTQLEYSVKMGHPSKVSYVGWYEYAPTAHSGYSSFSFSAGSQHPSCQVEWDFGSPPVTFGSSPFNVATAYTQNTNMPPITICSTWSASGYAPVR